MENKKEYDLYNDIQKRTNGEIYIGVLGPVRTGKSTFIKRFMEEMVLPNMEDEHERLRAQDELPQSAGGKTITTTEPKFIPNEAANVVLGEQVEVGIRLIDCVGYMVQGAVGHLEGEQERMVKTPWFQHEIPFTQAAAVGTDKVMMDHSTIGLVVTTDGSIGELAREDYLEAEEKTIMALKKLNKPFLVLVNSKIPFSKEAKDVADWIQETYDAATMVVNCEQLKREDINLILEKILYEFPITAIEFYVPKWVEILSNEKPLKKEIIEKIRELMKNYRKIRDILECPIDIESQYIISCSGDRISFSDGVVKITLDVDETFYYEMLTEMVDETITDEYQLLHILQKFSEMKKEYAKVKDALHMVRLKGYGVVTPEKDEIMLDQPELIRHGNKYGVKIHASSPSIHLIRANIETEIAPIVGTKEQAEDLIHYIKQADMENGIWDTNIFGKTVEQLVQDGISAKILSIGEDSQLKLQDTMQKVVNDLSGGMICIII